jgi:hypothetical protein
MQRIDFPTSLVPGYERTVHGEELQYHSPVPYVDRSLLVRSLDRKRDIEWETAPVPDDFAGDTAVFVFMAGIDINEDSHRFDLFVNGEPVLQFTNPRTSENERPQWSGDRGVSADFRVTLIDKYSDAMGFVFLEVPRTYWDDSRSLRLRVAGESADSRTWFMVFKESIGPSVRLQNAPALLRADPENKQIVRVDLLYLGDRGEWQMQSPIGDLDTTVTLGHNGFQLPVAAVERDTTVPLRLQLDDSRLEASFVVEPVRPLDLYLVHHTHLDIGYTHHQDEVERLQWDHLKRALAYGAGSRDYPEESRFVWNPEGLWAVESYLENHGAAERARLIEGVREGWIALDGMFANLLTGIASDEGLMRSLETARRLSDITGVPIESAMLSDIPGFTWGLVPVLAQHAIRYLSIGPNLGHRIGHFSDVLGDKPFYWESPSGKERVLTWVSGAGYAWFHSGLGYSNITEVLDDESVFKYLDRLVEEGYPYAIAHMRYNIGSDNGPPDPTLADAVREWNDRYASPRLIISTTSELFKEFEERYGEALPVYRGDLTGHWEDGAASSALETAAVRRAAESLVQTEALAAMLDRPLGNDELYRAWRYVLLYYEHTWGSWNSISEPESEFTVGQWRRKKEFADQAVTVAAELRRVVVADRAAPAVEETAIAVYNSLSWSRSDVILLPPEHSTAGDRVTDETGIEVRSQRLQSGELAFLAEHVPAFGERRYTVAPGSAGSATVRGENKISNGLIELEVDRRQGTISSLVFDDKELVGDSTRGLNEYLYVSDRSPDSVATSGSAGVVVRESGPLVWSIESRSAAPGTSEGITSEVRLYAGLDRIDITNTVDKTLVYSPEAVLYRFPFALADAEVRIDIPWGSFRPQEDQIAGSSKNYMSAQRWVDVHNAGAGVTVVTLDAPLVQLGEVRTDAIVTGWLDTIQPSATLFSYVMNNYWETNYRAGQDGLHTFHYTLRPHLGFDEAQAERFSTSIGQPLVAVPVGTDRALVEPPFQIEADRVVVSKFLRSATSNAYVVRLFNPGDRADRVMFGSRQGRAPRVYGSDVWERRGDLLESPIMLEPYEVVTVVVVP